MIVIKTVWRDELAIAKECFSPVLHVSGYFTVWKLDQVVPKDCKGIVSFGTCAGLSPDVSIGQVMCASSLNTDKGEHTADKEWRSRVFERTRLYVQPWYSTWLANAANDRADRAKLFREHGGWCFDNDSVTVAEFAELRKIPFIVFRSASTSWVDNLPADLDFLNLVGLGIDGVHTGTFDYASALAGIVKASEYAVLVNKLMVQHQAALVNLRQAATNVGKDFCFNG